MSVADGPDSIDKASADDGRILLQIAIISPQTDSCGTQIKSVSAYKLYQIAAIALQNAADTGSLLSANVRRSGFKVITLINYHGYRNE